MRQWRHRLRVVPGPVEERAWRGLHMVRAVLSQGREKGGGDLPSSGDFLWSLAAVGSESLVLSPQSFFTGLWLFSEAEVGGGAGETEGGTTTTGGAELLGFAASSSCLFIQQFTVG